MNEPDDLQRPDLTMHTSIAGFIVWLSRRPVARPQRQEYPAVVERFLRWRRDCLAAGQECDEKLFIASLNSENNDGDEISVRSDAISHYLLYLADEPR